MVDLKEIKATPKTGDEYLKVCGEKIDYRLVDFWKWSVSDILSNTTRGRFAEFIVGTAIGFNPNKLRDEWDAYDLTSDDGIKIEVKSAAYIQCWKQTDYSKITFSIKASKSWSNEFGEIRSSPKRHADLYVFCLLKHKEQETIEPLNMDQWGFYVIPTYVLDNYKRSKTSITLNSLRKLTEQVEYYNLKDCIQRVYVEQKNYTQHPV